MKNKWENYSLKDGKVQSSYVREYSSLSPRKRLIKQKELHESIRKEEPAETHQQGQQRIQKSAERRSEAEKGNHEIKTREEEEMKHRKPAAERLYSEKAEKKMDKVYKEFGKGELHSGSKKGPIVKDVKQASAIAISEAKKAGLKAGEKWKKSERKK